MGLGGELFVAQPASGGGDEEGAIVLAAKGAGRHLGDGELDAIEDVAGFPIEVQHDGTAPDCQPDVAVGIHLETVGYRAICLLYTSPSPRD